MDFYNQIIFTSLLLSTLISIALFTKSKSNEISNKFLAIHLFLTALFVLDVYFNLKNIFLIIPHYYRVYTPLQYLILPALYIHIRLLLFPDKKISFIDFLWFIPVVIQIIDLTPLYFSDKQQKINLLNAISNQKLNFQPQNEGFIFPKYFHSLFKIFLAFICDILILKNIIEYFKKRSNPLFIKNKFIWATTLFGISLIFQTIPYLLAFTLNHPFQLVFIHSMAFGIISISIFLIFTPGLLYDEIYTSKITINKEELDSGIEENFNSKQNLKDNKFDINESTCLECKQKIIDTIVKEKLYLSPNCSLKMISEATDIPSHHITIVMKKCIDKRFNDFVNELRIDGLIKEVESSPNNNLTIEGLSNNYGFQSKSTFYRAFKKYKGCTPKEFFKKEKA